MKNIVEFFSVSKTYVLNHWFSMRKIAALKDFSLKLEKGEIVGLLGLNGAGKTTIMKILCGLLFPSSGNVEIMGKSPLFAEAKRDIGYLPEFPYFHPNITAPQTLNYYLKLSGRLVDNWQVDKILEKVGLLQHRTKKVSEYSKGMKQRLGLAQALIHQPEILILDEPVSGLDPLAIHEIRNLILSINKEGKTIFLSSHSISELEKICDRVVILSLGRIIEVIQKKQWEHNPKGLERIFIEALKNENQKKS